MPKKGALSVWETIVLHLARFSRFREEFEVPVGVSQDGIAEGCGVSRAHAALELGKLKEKGKITERLAHVKGGKSKKKVYFLSDLAYHEAVAMRDSAVAKKVTILKAGKAEELPGDAALQQLTGAMGLPEARALSLMLLGEPIDAAAMEVEREEARQAPPPTGDAFFGREEEVESLQRWLSDGGRFKVILGMQGIGKSSLAAKAFGDSDIPTLWYSATGLDTAEHLAREMARLLGPDPRYKRLLEARPLDTREAALLMAAEKRRALVVISGYSVASKALDPLMFAFLGTKGGVGIVLCCEKKPEFYGVPELTRGDVSELSLVGLDPEACAELLERRGITEPETVRRLSEVTGGHPMALSLVSPDAQIAERDALRHLVRDVLGELTKDNFDALSLLSVHRVPVPASALGAGPLTVNSLLSAGLAFEDADGRLAEHPVVKATVTSMLTPGLLKGAHSSAADFYLNAGVHHERLYHLWKAGRKPEAARHLRMHLDKIRATGSLSEALEMAKESLIGISPQTDAAVAELAMDVGDGETALSISKRLAESTGGGETHKSKMRCARLLMRKGDFPGALRYLSGLDEEHEAEALRVQGGIERRMGRLDKAQKTMEKAYQAAECSCDDRLAGEAANELGVLALNSSKAEKALGWFEKALVQARKCGLRADEAMILANIALCHAENDDLKGASDSMGKALKITRSAGLLRIEAAISTNLAHVDFMQKDYGASARVGGRAVELLGKLGDKWLLGGALINHGRALIALGKTREGLAQVEEGLGATEMLGDLSASVRRYVDAAKAYQEAGDDKKRRAAARRAAELAKAIGDEHMAGEARKLAK